MVTKYTDWHKKNEVPLPCRVGCPVRMESGMGVYSNIVLAHTIAILIGTGGGVESRGVRKNVLRGTKKNLFSRFSPMMTRVKTHISARRRSFAGSTKKKISIIAMTIPMQRFSQMIPPTLVELETIFYLPGNVPPSLLSIRDSKEVA